MSELSVLTFIYRALAVQTDSTPGSGSAQIEGARYSEDAL